MNWKSTRNLLGQQLNNIEAHTLTPLIMVYAKSDNKTNAHTYPNIGSLKTVIEDEWNKMSG